MRITYKNVSPIIEAIKQGLRVIAVAIVPLIISQLQSDKFDIKIIATTGAIALLMAIDKYLHLEGKVIGNDLLKSGLTRF